MSDQLTKYLFADNTVRAQTINLQQTWLDVHRTHDYPPAVTRLLGELVAASALLSANLKFDGTLLLQLQGDGDIVLVVVECRSDLSLRATVKIREGAVIPADATLQALLNPGGNGRFTVVLDPAHRAAGQQPYQGVVPLVGDTVAAALEHYMATSEQLQTRLWLQADDQKAAGLLLQRLPHEGGRATTVTENPDETWERAVQLATTLRANELLEIDSQTLIHRLYWEETLTVFEPEFVRFHCPCSRDKVADVLRLLGKDEVESIVAEQGQVDVKCDYCGQGYVFDPVDCAEVFASDTPPSAGHQSSSTH